MSSNRRDLGAPAASQSMSAKSTMGQKERAARGRPFPNSGSKRAYLEAGAEEAASAAALASATALEAAAAASEAAAAALSAEELASAAGFGLQATTPRAATQAPATRSL